MIINWLQHPLERIIRTERLFPLGLCCGPGLFGNGTCLKPCVGHTLLFQPPVRWVQFVSFSGNSREYLYESLRLFFLNRTFCANILVRHGTVRCRTVLYGAVLDFFAAGVSTCLLRTPVRLLVHTHVLNCTG